MSKSALPAVNWQLGQTLLPEHLIAQENSLIANMALRDQGLGLPIYGISYFEWDTQAMLQGCVQVTQLRLLTRAKSTLVDFPQNARIDSAPLELTGIFSTNIYYTVLLEDAPEDSSLEYNNSSSIDSTDVLQKFYHLIFSFSEYLPIDYAYLLETHSIIEQNKLARFDVDANGQWQLSHSFIPPLRQVGASAFFKKPLITLELKLKRFSEYLVADSGENLSGSQKLSNFITLQHCITTLRYLDNLNCLNNSEGEIQPHPYFVYENLCVLLSGLELSGLYLLGEKLPVYKHDDLATIFGKLFERLSQYLKNDDVNDSRQEFILKDGSYDVSLSTNTQCDDNFYLIIESPRNICLQENLLPQVSSKRHLRKLRQYSLSGITLTEVTQDALCVEFSSDNACYRLEPGDELSLAIRDHSLAFLAQSDFQNYRFYLYQTAGASCGLT